MKKILFLCLAGILAISAVCIIVEREGVSETIIEECYGPECEEYNMCIIDALAYASFVCNVFEDGTISETYDYFQECLQDCGYAPESLQCISSCLSNKIGNIAGAWLCITGTAGPLTVECQQNYECWCR